MDDKSINYLVNYHKGFLAAHSKLWFALFELTKNDLKKIYSYVNSFFIQSESMIKIKTIAKLGDDYYLGS